MPIYMKFDTIPGESQDIKGAIEVDSFAWGLSNSSPGGAAGGDSGRVQFQDFQFVKSEDSTSPVLFLSCASGKHFQKVEIHLRKSTDNGVLPLDYLKIDLEDVMVSSFSQAGAGEVPTESISLNFAKILMTHTPQSSDGSPAGKPITAGWDLAVGKKL